jgi:hypothetical protein
LKIQRSAAQQSKLLNTYESEHSQHEWPTWQDITDKIAPRER